MPELAPGDKGFLAFEDFVNTGGRHHCFRKVLVPEMLLHQVFFLRRHWHTPAREHFNFEQIIHIFRFDLFNRWCIVLWLVESLPNS